MSDVSDVKLISTDIENHPDFGNSFNAKNKETRIYTIGELTIKFFSEEWYYEGDTDVEVWIEIGGTRKSPFSEPDPPLRFDMFIDESDSRVSMSRGIMGTDQIALLVTIMEESDGDGEKYKVRKSVVEEGSASEMHKEWIALAGASKLSTKDFTDRLIGKFGIWWFGGLHFLPILAAKEKQS
mmetsp:Transcript_8116/g.12292  ORF Transcript_8116/g.12292 Transcript_8116/m.12292 type:complete len:182 (+) Transcript_8116:62-607(+)